MGWLTPRGRLTEPAPRKYTMLLQNNDRPVKPVRCRGAPERV